MLLLLALTACTPTPTLGATTAAGLDDLRALVSDHADAVRGVDTVDEVTTLETQHAADMASAMSDTQTMMTQMMGCTMDQMMSDAMSDADTHMQDMTDMIAAHQANQSDHTDIAACWDEETDYESGMGTHLDAMASDMAGFDDTAECTSGSGGMM